MRARIKESDGVWILEIPFYRDLDAGVKVVLTKLDDGWSLSRYIYSGKTVILLRHHVLGEIDENPKHCLAMHAWGAISGLCNDLDNELDRLCEDLRDAYIAPPEEISSKYPANDRQMKCRDWGEVIEG